VVGPVRKNNGKFFEMFGRFDQKTDFLEALQAKFGHSLKDERQGGDMGGEAELFADF